MEDKNKLYTSTLIIFWLTLAFFILAILSMFLELFPRFMLIVVMPLIALVSVLGITLIILAPKAGLTKIGKIFFILTGASAIGIGVSMVLHNLVYALFIKLFGQDVWGSSGDEPVFFILATIICPLALLTGFIGSIVLIAKKKVKKLDDKGVLHE
jgi:hypothetical protein